VELASPVGGGSLPGQTLPSFGVSLRVASPALAARALRTAAEPILARVEDDELRFDLRTVSRIDDGAIAKAIRGRIAEDR
jgi:L-seryl-tRNA(Ser) seleniumtransferase